MDLNNAVVIVIKWNCWCNTKLQITQFKSKVPAAAAGIAVQKSRPQLALNPQKSTLPDKAILQIVSIARIAAIKIHGLESLNSNSN